MYQQEREVLAVETTLDVYSLSKKRKEVMTGSQSMDSVKNINIIAGQHTQLLSIIQNVKNYNEVLCPVWFKCVSFTKA